MFTRALSIAEAALGPDHPTVATRLGNLAAAYSTLGRTADALSAASRAEKCARANIGVHHPISRSLQENLAHPESLDGEAD